jgi:hypothetical protein
MFIISETPPFTAVWKKRSFCGDNFSLVMKICCENRQKIASKVYVSALKMLKQEDFSLNDWRKVNLKILTPVLTVHRVQEYLQNFILFVIASGFARETAKK